MADLPYVPRSHGDNQVPGPGGGTKIRDDLLKAGQVAGALAIANDPVHQVVGAHTGPLGLTVVEFQREASST